jgi:hypothetical protein
MKLINTGTLPDTGLKSSPRALLASTPSPFSNTESAEVHISKDVMESPLFDRSLLTNQVNVENAMALNQTALGYTGKFIGNLLKTVTFETLKVGGLIYGMGQAAVKSTYGDSSWSDLWDNPVYNTLDEIQTGLGEKMKVYHTEEYNNSSAIGKLASGQWWAETGADGLGFMASMIVPGQAMKLLGIGGKMLNLTEHVARGANTALRATNLISDTNMLGRVGRTINAAGDVLQAEKKLMLSQLDEVAQIAKSPEALAKASLTAEQAQEKMATLAMRLRNTEETIAKTKGFFNEGFSSKFIYGANSAVAAITSSVIESAAEASQKQKHMIGQLLEKNPTMSLKEATTLASEKAADVFGQNLILLTLSNAIDELSIFKFFNKATVPQAMSRRVWQNTVGRPETLSRFQKFVNHKGVRIGGTMTGMAFKEAWEESSQANISESNIDANGYIANFRDAGMAALTAVPDMFGKNADEAVAGAVLGLIGGSGGLYRNMNHEKALQQGLDARTKSMWNLWRERTETEGLEKQFQRVYDNIQFTKKYEQLEKEGKLVDGQLTEELRKEIGEEDAKRVDLAISYNDALKAGDKIAISQIEDSIVTNVLLKALNLDQANGELVDAVATELIKTFEEQHDNPMVATSINRIATALKATQKAVNRTQGEIRNEFDRKLYNDKFRYTLATILETNKYNDAKELLAKYELPEDYIDNYDTYNSSNLDLLEYNSEEESEKHAGSDFYNKVGTEEITKGRFVNVFERRGQKYFQSKNLKYIPYVKRKNNMEYILNYERLKQDPHYDSLITQNIEDQEAQEKAVLQNKEFSIEGKRIYRGESTTNYHKEQADFYQGELANLFNKEFVDEQRKLFDEKNELSNSYDRYANSAKEGEVFVSKKYDGYIEKVEGKLIYNDVGVTVEVDNQFFAKNKFTLDEKKLAKKEISAYITHMERHDTLIEMFNEFVDVHNSIVNQPESPRSDINRLIQDGKDTVVEYMDWLNTELELLSKSSIYKDDYKNVFIKKEKIRQKLALLHHKMQTLAKGKSMSSKLRKRFLKKQIAIEKIKHQDRVDEFLENLMKQVEKDKDDAIVYYYETLAAITKYKNNQIDIVKNSNFSKRREKEELDKIESESIAAKAKALEDLNEKTKYFRKNNTVVTEDNVDTFEINVEDNVSDTTPETIVDLEEELADVESADNEFTDEEEENNVISIIASFDISEKNTAHESVPEVEETDVTIDTEFDSDYDKSSIVNKTVGVDVNSANGEDIMIPQSDGTMIKSLNTTPYNVTRRKYFNENNISDRNGQIVSWNKLPEKIQNEILEGNESFGLLSEEDESRALFVLILNGDDYQKHNGKYVINAIPLDVFAYRERIYYDINSIKQYLSKFGEIKILDGMLTFKYENTVYNIATINEENSITFNKVVLDPLIEKFYQQERDKMIENGITGITFNHQSNGIANLRKDKDGKYVETPLNEVFNKDDITGFTYNKKGKLIGANKIVLKNRSEIKVQSTKISKEEALEIIKVISGMDSNNKYKGVPAIYDKKTKSGYEMAILSQYYTFGNIKLSDKTYDSSKPQMFAHSGIFTIITKEGKVLKLNIKSQVNAENKKLIEALMSFTKKIDAKKQGQKFNILVDDKVIQKDGKDLMTDMFTTAIVSKEDAVVSVYHGYEILTKSELPNSFREAIVVTDSVATETENGTTAEPDKENTLLLELEEFAGKQSFSHGEILSFLQKKVGKDKGVNIAILLKEYLKLATDNNEGLENSIYLQIIDRVRIHYSNIIIKIRTQNGKDNEALAKTLIDFTNILTESFSHEIATSIIENKQYKAKVEEKPIVIPIEKKPNIILPVEETVSEPVEEKKSEVIPDKPDRKVGRRTKGANLSKFSTPIDKLIDNDIIQKTDC